MKNEIEINDGKIQFEERTKSNYSESSFVVIETRKII